MKHLIAYSFIGLMFSGCFGSSTVSVVGSAPTHSAKLTWGAATGVVSGYYIEQSTDDVNFSQVQTVGVVTTAIVPNLVIGSTYYFRVRAYNPGGNSPYSPVASLVVPSPTPTP